MANKRFYWVFSATADEIILSRHSHRADAEVELGLVRGLPTPNVRRIGMATRKVPLREAIQGLLHIGPRRFLIVHERETMGITVGSMLRKGHRWIADGAKLAN